MKPLNKWTSADIIGFAKSVDKKTWVAVASGAVAFALVLVFLVIPAWIQRPFLRHDIHVMEAQIRQVNALNQKRLIWEENEKIFSALIEKTKERLFTAESLSVLLGQVSKMADESRVEVLASKPSVEKNVFQAPYHLRYKSSGYEFALQGGFHDLAGLVGRTESSKKLLRIRSLHIVPSDKTPDRQIAELKLWAILSVSPAAAPSAAAAGANNAKQ